MPETINVDLESIYHESAKLSALPDYISTVIGMVGEGKDVILTGKAPVWLYLVVAHALHGKAKKLVYRSPVTGDVVIFDHDPF